MNRLFREQDFFFVRSSKALRSIQVPAASGCGLVKHRKLYLLDVSCSLNATTPAHPAQKRTRASKKMKVQHLGLIGTTKSSPSLMQVSNMQLSCLQVINLRQQRINCIINQSILNKMQMRWSQSMKLDYNILLILQFRNFKSIILVLQFYDNNINSLSKCSYIYGGRIGIIQLLIHHHFSGNIIYMYVSTL